MLSPICLFTYNRPEETRLTVEALQNNYLATQSNLYIFSDGPKNESAKEKVNEVRVFINSVVGFKSVKIFESQTNNGLANSIINGVTEIIGKYGKVIVLEDDLISSQNFLNFMNQALEFYDQDKRIQSVNGYSLNLHTQTSEVYFQTRPFPWGWATWSDRWDKEIFEKNKLRTLINSDKHILSKFRKSCGNDISKMLLDSIANKNDSWYVRWTFDHFQKNRFSLFPEYSFISNIGHNADGTHCKGINTYFSIPVDEKKIDFNFSEFHKPNIEINNNFLNYFTIQHKLIIRLKLLLKKEGRLKIIQELKTKINAK